ncbi:hypothetical protein [Paenibacillus gansuensis]|uniref:Uncharacterized protein n=1 Tax=Paenibacillus gansuensis TaxID=306542 RepID=A0ABW5PA64_9BACL
MFDALWGQSYDRVTMPPGADIYSFIETYIAKREQQISEIEKAIERYEKRRMKEEQTYQAMSGIRKMLTGKKPDHHLAVEYIHYVKKPMETARRLRQEIEAAKAMLEQHKS